MTHVLNLLKQIDADPSSTVQLVERFLGHHGSPVVQDGTATFFLRGPYDHVVLVRWVFGLESRIPFHRLPNTDIWSLSVELPESSRIEYKFEVVQAVISAGLRIQITPTWPSIPSAPTASAA